MDTADLRYRRCRHPGREGPVVPRRQIGSLRAHPGCEHRTETASPALRPRRSEVRDRGWRQGGPLACLSFRSGRRKAAGSREGATRRGCAASLVRSSASRSRTEQRAPFPDGTEAGADIRAVRVFAGCGRGDRRSCTAIRVPAPLRYLGPRPLAGKIGRAGPATGRAWPPGTSNRRHDRGSDARNSRFRDRDCAHGATRVGFSPRSNAERLPPPPRIVDPHRSRHARAQGSGAEAGNGIPAQIVRLARAQGYKPCE